MHIGFFTSELSHKKGNYAGGLGNIAMEMITYLARQNNINLYVFTLSKDDGDEPIIERDNNIIYHWFPMNLFGTLTNNNYNTYMKDFCDQVNLFIIEKYLAGDNNYFDILHFHDWMVIPILLNIHRLKFPNVKRILHMHSTEYARIGNKILYNDPDSIYKHNLELAGCHSADLVVPVSQGFAEEIAELFMVPNDKVRYINNGICYNEWLVNKTDHKQIRATIGINEEDPIIVFCGRIVWQKNPRLILDSFMNIIPVFPRARLVFLGDGHMRKELEEVCRKNRLLGSSVHFLGNVHGKAKMDWYTTADIVAVPSKNEPFGLIILEALISGTPVLIPNNIAPAKFLNPEVSYMFRYQKGKTEEEEHNQNVIEMQKVIISALKNKTVTTQMGILGKEYVMKNFSSSIMGRDIYKMYRDILSSRSNKYLYDELLS